MSNKLALKLFLLDTAPPQGRFDWAASVCFLMSFGSAVVALYTHLSHLADLSKNSPPWSSVTDFSHLMICCVFFTWLGLAFSAIAKLSQNGQKYSAYVLKRLEEQDDLIRQLEAQITALNTQNPSTPA